MTENFGERDRHRHERALVAAFERRVGGKRKLGDLELLVVEHALEGLTRAQNLDIEVDALRLHAPVNQRAGAIVVPAGERELEMGHKDGSATGGESLDITHTRFKAYARKGLRASRFGRGWRRQPSEAGTPFKIEQQAERQGREHGRRRHPGGSKQVGDPMIADVEEMKGAVGAKEQTHPIEAGPELIRHKAALATGERGVKHVREPRKARIADIYPHEVEIGEHRTRIAVDADHVQHRRIAGAKQRPNCKCHRHRLGRRDLAIEALVAPADFKSVKVRKPCREVAERAQAAPARLLRKRGVRNDDAGVIAMTDDKHLGGRRARRRRPQAAVAPASGGNRGNHEQQSRDRTTQANTSCHDPARERGFWMAHNATYEVASGARRMRMSAGTNSKGSALIAIGRKAKRGLAPRSHAAPLSTDTRRAWL